MPEPAAVPLLLPLLELLAGLVLLVTLLALRYDLDGTVSC